MNVLQQYEEVKIYLEFIVKSTCTMLLHVDEGKKIAFRKKSNGASDGCHPQRSNG